MPGTGGHQIFLSASFGAPSWRVGAVTGAAGMQRIYAWNDTFYIPKNVKKGYWHK